MNNDFVEEEETEKVILNNKIEINSLNNKDDIKIKIVRVGELTEKHYFLNKDGVVL